MAFLRDKWRPIVKDDAYLILELSQDPNSILGLLLDLWQPGEVVITLDELDRRFQKNFGERWPFTFLGFGDLRFIFLQTLFLFLNSSRNSPHCLPPEVILFPSKDVRRW